MVDIKLLKEIKKRLEEFQTNFDDALRELEVDIMKVFHAWSEIEVMTPRFKPFPMVIKIERVHEIAFSEVVDVGSVINKHGLYIETLKTKERSDSHSVSRYLIYTCVPMKLLK